MDYSSLWSAFISTTLISGAPNIILLLFPNYASSTGNSNTNSLILSMGQALAAGGLLGDVFLHSHSHSSDDDHDDSDGIWLLLGFTFFFFMDIMLRSLEHDHDSHDDSHDEEQEENGKECNSSPSKHEPTKQLQQSLWNSPTVLNLVGDALHNFTDGLAIGASYGADSTSSTGGWIATISILLHEIPHELGDYCLLLQNGFTKLEAIGLQFVTAIAAFVGTGVGWYLAASTNNSSSSGSGTTASWNIEALTKGGFVYLATVTILPQGVLLMQPPSKKVILWRCAQFLAFCSGIACLYAVALLEEHDPNHSHSHHGHSHHDHDHHHHSSSSSMSHDHHDDHHHDDHEF